MRLNTEQSRNYSYSTILDKSFLAATNEGRILNHGFNKEEFPNIYMLQFKILKEPNWSCSKSKLFTIFYLLNLVFFYQRTTDTDVCPLRNLQSQSPKHMLSTCTVFSSFWTCFPYWWQEKFNQNWLYLRALFYMVGTKSQIIGKFLITVWLSPNNIP